MFYIFSNSSIENEFRPKEDRDKEFSCFLFDRMHILILTSWNFFKVKRGEKLFYMLYALLSLRLSASFDCACLLNFRIINHFLELWLYYYIDTPIILHDNLS